MSIITAKAKLAKPKKKVGRRMELKKEVESLLFSSGKVMKEKELAELTNHPENEIKEALGSLKKDYDERDTSLVLMQSGDSWKLNVREKYMGLVTKIVADTELPFPILETLGIIAFKAPAFQAEIVKSRGTNAYEHIGVLVEAGFVEKKKEGRSFRLILTPKFFQYFEVAGHDGMKEALKDVKVPEQKPAQAVGNLEVVDLPPEQQKKGDAIWHPNPAGVGDKNMLGELEVVDALPKAPRETIDTIKPDNNFLDDIDQKIEALSRKNDNADKDESFKRIDLVKDLGLEGIAPFDKSLKQEGEPEEEENPEQSDDKVEVIKEDDENEDADAEEGDEETDDDESNSEEEKI